MSDKLGSRDVGFLDFECGKYPEEFPSFCTVHYNTWFIHKMKKQQRWRVLKCSGDLSWEEINKLCGRVEKWMERDVVWLISLLSRWVCSLIRLAALLHSPLFSLFLLPHLTSLPLVTVGTESRPMQTGTGEQEGAAHLNARLLPIGLEPAR